MTWPPRRCPTRRATRCAHQACGYCSVSVRAPSSLGRRRWPFSVLSARFEAVMEPEVVVDAEQQRKDQALAAFRAKLLQHKARGCALPAPCA